MLTDIKIKRRMCGRPLSWTDPVFVNEWQNTTKAILGYLREQHKNPGKYIFVDLHNCNFDLE